MISPDVQWVDIDAEQWQHLWELLFGPRRRPTYVYGILEHGAPVALVHSRDGQLDLARWPAGISQEDAAAARERHRAALAELPPYALQLSRGYPAIPTVFDEAG